MYTDSFFLPRYRKLQAALPSWHPCATLSNRQCRKEFLDATV